MLKHGFAATLLAVGMVAASSGSARASTEVDAWDQARALAAGNNAFAFDLYRELKQSPGNLFFSPYSVRIALVMAYAGARGGTARQIRQALHIDLDDETLHKTLGALISAVETSSAEGYVLTTANSLWIEESMPVLPAFLERVQQDYGGVVESVDFTVGPRAAGRRINAWITDRTDGLIRNAVDEHTFTEKTRFVLINAVHFKGIWESPFQAHRTLPMRFDRSDGSMVMTPFMLSGIPMKARLYEGSELRALWLDYKGHSMSLVVILPRPDVDLAAIESTIGADLIGSLEAESRVSNVIVGLPRFTIEPDAVDLGAALRSLGMVDAFEPSIADFSAINGDDHSLYLDGVHHKAFIDVNEQGTEAAAVTVVSGPRRQSRGLDPPPVATFFADRPFLFLIQERHTGIILFAGRLSDPS